MKLAGFVAAFQHSDQRWLRFLPGLGVVLLALLAYGNSFPGIFVQDDLQIVLYNPLVQQFDLARIVRSDYWGIGQNSGLYRPLTIFSLALNRQLFGVNPWGFHLVNVFLHALVSLSAYHTLRLWGWSNRLAWLTAALFAVHPLHAEVVNVVVGRSELLAALFLLLALALATSQRWKEQLLAAGAFFLALLSKEHAVLVLLLLPVIDVWRARNFVVWRQRAGFYSLLVMITLLWLGWRQWGVDHQGAAPFIAFAENNPLGYLPPLTRILTALDLQYHYLARLIWPYPLQVSYYGIDFHGPIAQLWSLRGGMALGGWLVICAGIVAGLRRQSDTAIFALLYLLTFSITANLLLPVGVAFAERLAYLPSLWFCAAVVSLGGRRDAGRAGKTPVSAAITGFILLLLVLSWGRNRDFRDPITLWKVEVARGEHDAFARMNLAVSFALEGETAAAEEVYRQLVQFSPPSPSALRSYAVFLLTQGRPEEAMVPARKALEVVIAQGDEFGEGLVLVMLADMAMQLREYQLALDYLARPAVRLQNSRGYVQKLREEALTGVGRRTTEGR